MAEFKKFVAIWFATMVAMSVLFIGWATVLNRPNISTEVKGSHFSVVWKGFKPTYSDQFPDYYICINNLKDESLQMYIQLKIENYENVSLYFMIDKYLEPPTDWYVSPQYFGFVDIANPIRTFTYYNFARTKPAAIPQGSLHESVELAVKAYYDSSYTQFYSQANFTVNFHFIDVTAPVWTKVIYDNFDDETVQGWSSAILQKWQPCRSWPCSITPYYSAYKTFDLFGNYTEAYFVAAVFGGPSSIYIYLDSAPCFYSDVTTGFVSPWCQIAIPLPVNRATAVMIGGFSYMDDVYVVAK
jgi:hypothetical protein